MQTGFGRHNVQSGCPIEKLSHIGDLRRYCIGDYIYLTMEIDLIFKIAAVGIIVAILNQVLSRSGRDEQATMTTLAGLVVVLMIVAQKISELFDLVQRLFDF